MSQMNLISKFHHVVYLKNMIWYRYYCLRHQFKKYTTGFLHTCFDRRSVTHKVTSIYWRLNKLLKYETFTENEYTVVHGLIQSDSRKHLMRKSQDTNEFGCIEWSGILLCYMGFSIILKDWDGGCNCFLFYFQGKISKYM
jgi:hypothetical protein